MDQTSITAAGAIDTFLVLLIGIGPKLALVPFLEITAALDPAFRRSGSVLVTRSGVSSQVGVTELVTGNQIP